MEDRSNIPQKWYASGTEIKTAKGLLIQDILLRWNERRITKKTDAGEELEYVYDATRLDLLIPGGVAVKDYLSKIQADLLAKTQDSKVISQKAINFAYLTALETQLKLIIQAETKAGKA